MSVENKTSEMDVTRGELSRCSNYWALECFTMGCLKDSLMTSSTGVHLGFWIYLVVGSVIYYFIENPLHLGPPAKRITYNS